MTVLTGSMLKKDSSSSSCSLQDQNLGNWQVKRQVGSGAPISFKFPAKFTLKAGQRVTVSHTFNNQHQKTAMKMHL